MWGVTRQTSPYVRAFSVLLAVFWGPVVLFLLCAAVGLFMG